MLFIAAALNVVSSNVAAGGFGLSPWLRVRGGHDNVTTADNPHVVNLANDKTGVLPPVVNLAAEFSKIDEPWSPRVAGDVNDFQVGIQCTQLHYPGTPHSGHLFRR